MKKGLSLCLATLMLVSIMLCALPSAVASAEKEDKDIVIAVIPQQLGNVVFLPAKQGMEDMGEKLGIRVEWQAPIKAEATEQVGIVESLIERGVDGIAISCTTPEALNDVLARAMREGIHVSTYDADSPDCGRAFFAGTNNYQAGFICGEEMIRLFEGSGLEKVRVAQLEGIPGAYDIQERMRGFADATADTNIEVIYSGPCDDDVDKAIEVIEAYTRANADNIDAWYMAGGWPYVVNPDATPEVNKWKAAEPVRKVVTLDVFPSSIAFFDRGLIDVAVGQDFYSMGSLSVENLYKLIKGEEIETRDDPELGKVIDTGLQMVYPDNYKTEITPE